MAENRSLKFNFELNETSFTRVKNALSTLTEQAKAFAVALREAGAAGGILGGGGVGGVGGGKGGGGGPPTPGGAPGSPNTPNKPVNLTSGVLANLEALKKFGKEGPQNLKKVTDAVKVAYGEQADSLKKLTMEYSNLEKARDQAFASGSTKQIKESTDALNENVIAAAKATNAMKRLGTVIGDKSGTGAIPPMLQGSASKAMAGLMSPVGSGGGIQGLLGNGIGAVALRAGGIAAAGIHNIVNTNQAWNNSRLDIQAQRGGMVNPLLQRMQGGDISDIVAMKAMSKEASQDREQFLKRFSGTDNTILNYVNATAGAMGQAGTGGPIGAGLTGDAQDNKRFEQMMDLKNKYQNTTSFDQTYGRALRYKSDSAGFRNSIGAAMGIGINFRPDKSRKDSSGVVVSDSYSDFAQKSLNAGFSPEEMGGAWLQARNLGGNKFANQYGGRIASANLGGYGGVGELLFAGARRGGNAALGAYGMGATANAATQLGQAVMGTGYDASGTTNRMGVMSAIQGGFGANSLVGGFTGGAQDFNVVQRIAGGLQTGNALSQGFDALQQGRNTLSAINAMPGASTYAQDTLAGMDYSQLLDVAKGGKSAVASAYGITSKQAKSQLSQLGGNVLDRFVDQGGGDFVSRAIREQRQSGLGLEDYLQTLKSDKEGKQKAQALGVFIGQKTGMGAEAGIGYVGLESGMDSLGKGLNLGNTPGGKRDDLSLKEMGQAAREVKAGADVLAGTFGTIYDSIGDTAQWEKIFTSFGKFEQGLDVLGQRMLDMAGFKLSDNGTSDLSGAFKVAASYSSAVAQGLSGNYKPMLEFIQSVGKK